MESTFVPYLLKFFLIMGRFGGFFFSMPFFTGQGFPAKQKLIFSFLTALIMVPVLSFELPQAMGSTAVFIPLMAGEIAIGIIMGLVINFVFAGIQLAGDIMGVEIGYSMIQIMDPTTLVQTPVLSVFWNLLAVTLFLVINGHHMILQALAQSYAVLPAGQLSLSQAAVEHIIYHSADVFTIGVKLAAPLLVVMVVVDVVIGLIGRAATTLNILIVGFPIKIIIGLLAIGISLYYFPAFFRELLQGALRNLERIFLSLR